MQKKLAAAKAKEDHRVAKVQEAARKELGAPTDEFDHVNGKHLLTIADLHSDKEKLTQSLTQQLRTVDEATERPSTDSKTVKLQY